MDSTILSSLRETTIRTETRSSLIGKEELTFSPNPPLEPFIEPASPPYLTRYPEIFDAVHGVKDLVAEWKAENRHGSFELEARLGVLKSGQQDGFTPGVSHSFMERTLAMLNTFQGHWKKETPWEETHDYYYLTSPDKSMVRTTSTFYSDPTTGKKEIRTTHIRKIGHKKLDYRFMSSILPTLLPPDRVSRRKSVRHLSERTTRNSPSVLRTEQSLSVCEIAPRYDLRVVLNYEEKIHRKDLPNIINPSFVRIKSRKTFFYTSENFPSSSPIWRIDLTQSWSGKSKSEAEIAQKTQEPVYEIELECLNPKALMISPKHDHFYVACSLLLKMRDFVSHFENNFKWVPVKKKLSAAQEQVVHCF